MNKKIGIFAGILALCTAGNAQAFLIDSFNDVQSASQGGVGTTTSNLAPGSFIGTNRKFVSTTTLNNDSNTLLISSGTGILNIAKGPNMFGSVESIWSGISGADSDFTVGGAQNAIELLILENNANFADIDFTVGDGVNTSTFTLTNVPFIPTGSPQTFYAPFASFSGSADFSVITDLSVLIDVSDFGNGADLQLDFVQTTFLETPIPAAVWLFGSGLLGLIGLSRRRTQ